MPTGDLAGKRHWDSLWSDAQVPTPINPRTAGARGYLDRRFHEFFSHAIPPGGELLEVGCARSQWLPYFALELGCAVTGLDYSERGCELEREVLRQAGVEGEVVCADLFQPPPTLVGRFDTVVSLGVVEHFSDTAGCIAALGRYLKPGGRLVTVIPNMAGLVGLLQRWLNRSVYDMHVPLGPQELAGAHGGTRVLDCRYFLSTNFGVLNAPHKTTLFRMSKIVWLVEDRTRPLPARRLLSPYIVSVAEHP